jgi:hypothetical protein
MVPRNNTLTILALFDLIVGCLEKMALSQGTGNRDLVKKQ